MYEAILAAHGGVRWLVLGLGLLALLQPRRGLYFAHGLTLQVLLGVFLAFVSPYFLGLLANPSEALVQREARFFLVEHWVYGLVALGLAHVAWARVRRGREGRLLFALALLLILLATPWDRPFLRFQERVKDPGLPAIYPLEEDGKPPEKLV